MYNINYYTGTPGISIPLYTLTEYGTSVPVSLSYDATGFIPNKNASVVGLNWNLSAGGAITRVVKGIADDKHNPNEEGPYQSLVGFIAGTKLRIQNNQPLHDRSYIQNLTFLENQSTPGVQNPLPTPIRLTHEYAPDIFTFNFMGHSGSFFMGNDGTVKVNSDRRYKVDLTEFYSQNDIGFVIQQVGVTVGGLNSHVFSRIKMKSDDGYEFHFGGEFKHLELSFSYANPTDALVIPSSGIINAWYLTKVIAPDGNIIEFKYKSYNESELEVIRNITYANGGAGSWLTNPVDFLEIKFYYRDIGNHIVIPSNGINNKQNAIVAEKTLVKMARLEEIQSGSTQIKFIYSTRDNGADKRFYSGFDDNTYIKKNPNFFNAKLDRLDVYSKIQFPGQPQVISPKAGYTFTYQMYGESVKGYRMFLKEIEALPILAPDGEPVTQTNPTIFDYSDLSQLPDPVTAGIDIWGFYNGVNTNTRLINLDAFVFGDPAEYETNFNYTGQVRLPDATKVKVGMLEKITYPTGGTTEFEFETHTYSALLKRKVNPPAPITENMIPVWENQNGIAGGARIKKITNTPGTTTHYKYTLSYEQNPNGLSSGLLTNNGVYRLKLQFLSDNSTYRETIFENNILQSSGYSEPHIGYKEVIEITGDGQNGFKKYSFTSHESNPDNYFLGSNTYKIDIDNPPYTSVPNFHRQLKRLYIWSDRSAERGKLSKEEFFSSSANKVKSVSYIYNVDPNRLNEYATGFDWLYGFTWSMGSNLRTYFCNSYQLYYYHNNLSKTIEETFSNGLTHSRTTELFYKSNSNSLLMEKTITQSDNSKMLVKYFYPEDEPILPINEDMINKHMVNTLLKEQTLRQTSQGTSPLASTKYTYNYFDQKIRLQHISTINHAMGASEAVLRTYLKYDPEGKVISYRDNQDVKMLYLWNVAAQKPIAEIQNVYDEAAGYGYTSFEPGEEFTSTYNYSGLVYYPFLPGGSRCYKLTGNTFSFNKPTTTAPHIVSYWSTNGVYTVPGTVTTKQGVTLQGWTYIEHEIANVTSVAIAGTGYIDEVRLYPKQSQMTSFVHHPSGALLTQSDMNNRLTHYAYDGLWRLRLIRNQDRHILKKFCYGLSGLSEDCSAPSDAVWSALEQFRCKPCPSNQAYISNIRQQLYIDVNPQSATYNTTNWVDVGTHGSCSPPPAWQNQGTTFCETNSNGNTGNVLQAQVDVNPCSPSYQSIQNIVVGYNTTQCPPPPACGPGNCSGADKKCINNICETAQKQYTSATYSRGVWTCTFFYIWSDCSTSQEYQETRSTAPSLAIIPC
jgi:hypothetical protein